MSAGAYTRWKIKRMFLSTNGRPLPEKISFNPGKRGYNTGIGKHCGFLSQGA